MKVKNWIVIKINCCESYVWARTPFKGSFPDCKKCGKPVDDFAMIWQGIALLESDALAEASKVQKRHDTMVNKLNLLTSKKLVDLTFEEFDWLLNRWLVPVGESNRSQDRRKRLHELYNQKWRSILDKWEKRHFDMALPTIAEITQMTYNDIQERELKWNC